MRWEEPAVVFVGFFHGVRTKWDSFFGSSNLEGIFQKKHCIIWVGDVMTPACSIHPKSFQKNGEEGE